MSAELPQEFSPYPAGSGAGSGAGGRGSSAKILLASEFTGKRPRAILDGNSASESTDGDWPPGSFSWPDVLYPTALCGSGIETHDRKKKWISENIFQCLVSARNDPINKNKKKQNQHQHQHQLERGTTPIRRSKAQRPRDIDHPAYRPLSVLLAAAHYYNTAATALTITLPLLRLQSAPTADYFSPRCRRRPLFF